LPSMQAICQHGFGYFIKFMALVSVSLGVLNLLPVPVLDGGHLLFFALEAIKGRPVSEKIQIFFQQVGIAFINVVNGIGYVFGCSTIISLKDRHKAKVISPKAKLFSL